MLIHPFLCHLQRLPAGRDDWHLLRLFFRANALHQESFVMPRQHVPWSKRLWYVSWDTVCTHVQKTCFCFGSCRSRLCLCGSLWDISGQHGVLCHLLCCHEEQAKDILQSCSTRSVYCEKYALILLHEMVVFF